MTTKINVFARNGKVVTTARPDLVPLFHRFNEEHFEGLLDLNAIELAWSGRLRIAAGKCWYQKNRYTGMAIKATKIHLSIKLFENVNFSEAEVHETLIHEMCHAYCIAKWGDPGHGWRFQSNMARIMKDGRRDYTYHNLDVTGLRNKTRRWY